MYVAIKPSSIENYSISSNGLRSFTLLNLKIKCISLTQLIQEIWLLCQLTIHI